MFGQANSLLLAIELRCQVRESFGRPARHVSTEPGHTSSVRGMRRRAVKDRVAVGVERVERSNDGSEPPQ